MSLVTDPWWDGCEQRREKQERVGPELCQPRQYGKMEVVHMALEDPKTGSPEAVT